MSTSDVYIEWPGGLAAAFWHASAYDTSTGLAFLTERMKEFDGFKRRVSLAATDINTGEVLTFGDHNIEWSELPQAVLASASVPGFFPPQSFKGHFLVDGMTAWNTNAQQAIDRCREIVEHDRDIIIDVITIGVSDDQKEIVETGHTSSNFLRSRNIKSAHNGGDALDEQIRSHPDIYWRHKIMEVDGHVTGMNELNFEPEITKPLQEQGKKDALAAIQKLKNNQ